MQDVQFPQTVLIGQPLYVQLRLFAPGVEFLQIVTDLPILTLICNVIIHNVANADRMRIVKRSRDPSVRMS